MNTKPDADFSRGNPPPDPGYVMDGTTPFRVIFRAWPRTPPKVVQYCFVGMPYTGPTHVLGRYEHPPGFDISQQVQRAIDHHSFHQARLNSRVASLRA